MLGRASLGRLETMRILVTNDDGYDAPGIQSLARAASTVGEVVIVAPDYERSACGHSMTMRDPLRVKEHPGRNFPTYAVNGLPVDCVNVGLSVYFPDGCDLVLSGINNGPNLGYDVTYSGTVAGAMEGCINGIPSIAFSMAVFADGAPFHYDTGEWWIAENLARLAAVELPPLTFLNVNIPAIAQPEIMGHKVVAMGQRIYEERVEERQDPWGRTYYWQGGSIVMQRDAPGTDVGAVNQGYVSITPISVDWTAREVLPSLERNLR